MLLNPKKRKERESTDFGRGYGWTILFNNIEIAQLSYIGIYGMSFSHEYKIIYNTN